MGVAYLPGRGLPSLSIKYVHLFIFLALAISDAIYVLTMVIHKSIPTIFEIESKYFYIKPIASPLSHVAYTTSMYLTVLLAFDRYVNTYRLLSFLAGGTKLERFLPKNQHTQRKLLNFENWWNGEVSNIGH